MSPSRYSSLILALAPALCGQPLASIDITAPRSWLLSARTMRLDARAATPLGLPVPNFAPAWRSLNPAVATIDSSGLVRGLAPGVASIEATAGGVTGRFKLEVYPGRIEITPRRVELRAGETMDLAAGAYDADGKVIPGVRFTWISSLANIAAVSPSGQLRAAAEGSTSITARVDAGAPEYNAEAQAAVIVRRRPDYQLAALAANDTEAGPVTYRYGSVASFAGDWITLWAGISSGAQALLLAGPGGTQALAVSGQFLDQAGRVLAGVRETSVNTRGDVAARLYFFPANCDVVFLFRNGGAEPIMRDCGAVLTPRSISDAGDVLFLLNGQLFLRRSDGSRELIARIGLDVPEFGVVTNFGDRQLWPSGQVIFELLNAQGQRGSFTWEGGQIRKLYARGETYDGGLINNGIVPVPSQSGDFYAVIQNTRTTQIARNSSGAWSNVLTSGQTYGSVRLDFIYVSFLDVSADGSLVFLGRTQQGDALLRRQGQTLEILARYGANVDWRSISQAFFTSQGVVASGAPRDALYRLYRFGEGGGPILQTGQAVEFPAPAGILWSGLLNTVSGPVFRTYIDSLARPGAEGVLSQGDTLPDGSTFTGVQGAAFDTNLNGDIAFVSNRLLLAAALYVWRGGTVSLVAAPNGSVRGSGDRVISNVFYPVSLNTRGQFV
ncbi:MAG: Ig-like domain-containing protein, partial [Candidatus Solibacter usitatus]|nr:Ig-like domain-containing protein [Candidatus Solibacter usitatus]